MLDNDIFEHFCNYEHDNTYTLEQNLVIDFYNYILNDDQRILLSEKYKFRFKEASLDAQYNKLKELFNFTINTTEDLKGKITQIDVKVNEKTNSIVTANILTYNYTTKKYDTKPLKNIVIDNKKTINDVLKMLDINIGCIFEIKDGKEQILTKNTRIIDNITINLYMYNPIICSSLQMYYNCIKQEDKNIKYTQILNINDQKYIKDITYFQLIQKYHAKFNTYILTEIGKTDKIINDKLEEYIKLISSSNTILIETKKYLSNVIDSYKHVTNPKHTFFDSWYVENLNNISLFIKICDEDHLKDIKKYKQKFVDFNTWIKEVLTKFMSLNIRSAIKYIADYIKILDNLLIYGTNYEYDYNQLVYNILIQLQNEKILLTNEPIINSMLGILNKTTITQSLTDMENSKGNLSDNDNSIDIIWIFLLYFSSDKNIWMQIYRFFEKNKYFDKPKIIVLNVDVEYIQERFKTFNMEQTGGGFYFIRCY